jgi:uncharacterized membrane protein
MIPLGVRLYGLGATATGLVGLAWGDFALQWEPVAASFPGRTALAYIFSALLVVAGAATNWRRSSAALGAAALVGLYAVVVVLMHGAQIAHHPGVFATWSGAAEQVALLAGGLASYAYLAGAHGGARNAVIAMGICLLTFGLAHFLYLDFTASMVPAWLPGGQKFWAVLTGAAHLAAGAALLTGIQARLAAILLTIMFATFSVLVHLPLLMADPHSHLNWVMNAINLGLTGAAWATVTAVAQTNTRREETAAGVAETNFADGTIRQGQQS